MLFRKKDEAIISVENMKCQHCAAKVVDGLKTIKVKAVVSLENKEVKVFYNGKKVTLEQIKNKINELGFGVL